MDVFDAFPPQAIKLALRVTSTEGDVAGEVFTGEGVLKQREGMSEALERDTRTGDATLYIRPSHPFVAATDGKMVGHYAYIATDDLAEQFYRIARTSEGKDFDTGEIKHYRLDLEKKEETVWQADSILE